MGHRASLLSLLILAFVRPTQADDSSVEKAKHRGTWSVISMIREDRDAEPEVLASIVRVVDGSRIVWKRDGKSFAGLQFTLGKTDSARTIDLMADGGPALGKRVLGIYRFEGEILTICVGDPGQPRPTSFEAKSGSRTTLQKFKRIKP